MEQYIKKSALVAEIEKAIDSPAPSHDQQCPWEDGYWCGLYTAEGIIDTLEVKEANEALRTEYEKGRADAIADTISWLANVWPQYCSNPNIIDAYKDGVVKD